ncbi:energy transducer TonB [Ereboglobus luteus]|nr:energy transducer TonB [Ereboglobus luteus]
MKTTALRYFVAALFTGGVLAAVFFIPPKNERIETSNMFKPFYIEPVALGCCFVGCFAQTSLGLTGDRFAPPEMQMPRIEKIPMGLAPMRWQPQLVVQMPLRWPEGDEVAIHFKNKHARDRFPDGEVIHNYEDLDGKPVIIKPENSAWGLGFVDDRGAQFETFEVLVIVDKHGVVRDARIVNPRGTEAEAAAIKAAGQWLFTPGRKNGVAVGFRMTVPVPAK